MPQVSKVELAFSFAHRPNRRSNRAWRASPATGGAPGIVLSRRSWVGFHGRMLSAAKVGPRRWPYYCNGVLVGDGRCRGGQAAARRPGRSRHPARGLDRPGRLAAVRLTAGDVVTERQAELLLGEGRHPDADQIERKLLEEGKSPAAPGGRPCWAGPSSATSGRRPRRPRSGRIGWPWTWCSGRHRRHRSRGRCSVRSTAWCWSCARTSPGTRRRRGWRTRSHRSVGGAEARTASRSGTG